MIVIYLAVLTLSSNPPMAQTIGRPMDDMRTCETVRLITIADWPIKHAGQPEPKFVCVAVEQ